MCSTAVHLQIYSVSQGSFFLGKTIWSPKEACDSEVFSDVVYYAVMSWWNSWKITFDITKIVES